MSTQAIGDQSVFSGPGQRASALLLRSGVVAAFVVACILTSGVALMAQSSSPRADSASYPHANESIGSVRQMYDGALTPEMAVHTFRNIDRLFPVRTVAHGAHPKQLPPSTAPLREVHFRDGPTSYDLEQYLDLNRVAGLLVLSHGRIALERYRYGNTERTRWMSMSVAKSITST
ncbi:MAG: hypothetical protein JJD97_16655, partial [Gemmatimonadaceae bacterium]|nr:hypothetical protein [Gemmatimonadaceae bacterium]